MTDNKTVGSRIKQIRLNEGLNLDEFGKLFSPQVSKGTVSKWENGKYLPNNNRLKKIAEIGKTSVNYLLNGDTGIVDKQINENLANFIKDFSSNFIITEELQNTAKEVHNAGIPLLTKNIDLSLNKNNKSLNNKLEIINNYFSKIQTDEAEISYLELEFLVEVISMIKEIKKSNISDKQKFYIYSNVTNSIKEIRNNLNTEN